MPAKSGHYGRYARVILDMLAYAAKFGDDVKVEHIRAELVRQGANYYSVGPLLTSLRRQGKIRRTKRARYTLAD